MAYIKSCLRSTGRLNTHVSTPAKIRVSVCPSVVYYIIFFAIAPWKHGLPPESQASQPAYGRVRSLTFSLVYPQNACACSCKVTPQ